MRMPEVLCAETLQLTPNLRARKRADAAEPRRPRPTKRDTYISGPHAHLGARAPGGTLAHAARSAAAVYELSGKEGEGSLQALPKASARRRPATERSEGA